MNCDDFRALFLSGEDAASFEQHATGCAACRSDRPRLERLRLELADPAQWLDPGLSADQVVDAVLGRQAETRPARGAVRRLAWRLGIAAVLVSVVGAFVVVNRHPADWNVALSGAESAPQATGQVSGWNVSGGSELVLTTNGLGPAPTGSVYELWFMSGDEAVSAGTFSDPGQVRLMVGVPWREYPNVLVTLQGADDPGPSDTWLLWSEWSEEEH